MYIDVAITYQDKLSDSTLKKIDNIRQLSRPYCLYLEKPLIVILQLN